MTHNNTPIPDAELAELRRLHAAATKGNLQARGFRLSHTVNRRIDYDVQHIDEIGQIGTGPYQAIPFARREDVEWHAALHNAFPAILARLEAAERERNDLQALIDIQHTRVVAANRLWREAHPGNDLVMPDLGRLIDWLMSRAEAAESTVAGLRRALEEADRDCWRGYNDTRSFIDANVPNWTRGDDGPSFELMRNANKRKAALAATSAEHERRIKADGLRAWVGYLRAEVAEHNPVEYASRGRIEPGYVEAQDDMADLLEAEADRLEAANGLE